jgi:UDP-N-acetylglucosamine:LPS N-acetylglucosamine transferase
MKVKLCGGSSGGHLQWYFVMYLTLNIRIVQVSNFLDQMKKKIILDSTFIFQSHTWKNLVIYTGNQLLLS